MSEDGFFERLRQDARTLRFEPDEVMTTRVSARIRERLAAPVPTATQFLARWFRPLTATFGALALAATIGAVWLDRTGAESSTPDLVAASGTIEISAAGDVYSVGE